MQLDANANLCQKLHPIMAVMHPEDRAYEEN